MSRTRPLRWISLALIAACSKPHITDVGPRVVSNQTSQPLTLIGTGFKAPMAFALGGRQIQATVLDATHAYARMPSEVAGGEYAIGDAVLRVVDDRAFPDLMALTVHKGTAYVASMTTDTVYVIRDGQVTERHVDDGPRALAMWNDQLVVAHAFAPVLLVGEKRYGAPLGASAVAVQGDVAYVAGQVADKVCAIDLRDGRELWCADVTPNPMAIVATPEAIYVGGFAIDKIGLDGKHLARIAPNKETRIVNGNTAAYSAYVMGGKAARGLAYAKGKLFVASIGPNVGPNPQRLEVTHAAGVGLIEGDRFVRHTALGAGVTEGIVANDTQVFAADIATGLVHVFDHAPSHLRSIVIPPPTGFPFVRPDAPGEVHSGPRSLALEGNTLYVLNRFSGTLALIDTQSFTVRQIPIVSTLAQQERRLGQILYYADLAHSGMSCDSCHPEGHMDGVFFEKTKPLRVYRATTVRGSMQTPPYFIPTSTRTLHDTNALVGNRNRLMKMKLTNAELGALTLFCASLVTLPNPFVGDDGAPRDALSLPDGHRGNPRSGLVLFERSCSSCHPAPLFTLDQSPATRDRHFDVGTPRVFPLRESLQDASVTKFPPPSLIGVWDEFPLFTSGTAGLGVRDDQLTITNHFPLRDIFTPKHGGSLSPQEQDDILAYVMSL